MDITQIQQALKAQGLDGWLFYDFHNRDAIAYRILGLDAKKMTTRRWYYFIPAQGEPKKLVHSIERGKLDTLPGQKFVYLPWPEQHQLLRQILGKAKKVAMQYSPLNAIPYVSLVDAGTVELVRSFGVEVVSSADLVGRFEAHLSQEDYQSHKEAGLVMHGVCDATFAEIGRRIKTGQTPTEVEIQAFMHQKMRQGDMYWEDGPIVAVNEHAADPHFEPTPENTRPMKKGDWVLLDLWAKKNRPGSIYFDITWVGYIGETVPEKYVKIFNIVKTARDTAVSFIEKRFSAKQPVYGWEVDDVCRQVIIDAGYGEYFIHRTGHNIGEEVHGNGVNIDNLETKDERLIQPGTCFSIEPGIYLEKEGFGVRTEVDVFVSDEGVAEVTGPRQEEVVAILKLSS
ncbi:MAG: Xaa-Pro peptidase family protein [candidate division KSB1 bacterium]|nr:Xaa-Pro peptidase family protein [candidate division KSB1 bacterium]